MGKNAGKNWKNELPKFQRSQIVKHFRALGALFRIRITGQKNRDNKEKKAK
jgi:hypothetical protein